MPNWCYNEMRISKEDAEKFILRKEIVNGGITKLVDFGIAVPMPESLRVESGSSNGENIYYFLSDKCTLGIGETISAANKLGINIFNLISNSFMSKAERIQEIAKRASRREMTEKDYKAGKILIENYLNYGCMTWYEWSYKNWGVKWNVATTFIEEASDSEYIIQFDTPWGPPTIWCQALAMMNVDFCLNWVEDQGSRGEIYAYGGEYYEEDLPNIGEDED